MPGPSDRIKLAWARVKSGASKHFVCRPFEFELVERDLDSWLERIEAELVSDRYTPGPLRVSNVPKGRGAIRPGNHLSLRDLVAFTAAVGDCYGAILSKVLPQQGRIEFGHALAPEVTAVRWVRQDTRTWSAFSIASLRNLPDQVTHVILGDVVGYYENVDIETLASDLRAIGSPARSVNLIRECLRKWSPTGSRGLPQNVDACHVLGKLYLDDVDRYLLSRHRAHVRYVDDIRIFCASERVAKQALLELIVALRSRGLNINSEKTAIHTKESARRILLGIKPAIDELALKFSEEVAQIFLEEGGYITVLEADEILKADPRQLPLAVIRYAFDRNFISTGSRFDKSLFHFILNRLGWARDRYALEYSFLALVDHPEETENLLAYLSRVASADELQNRLVTFLQAEDAVYRYQNYLVVKWLAEEVRKPSAQLMELTRQLAYDGNAGWEVSAWARVVLGRFGEQNDLEDLAAAYSETRDEVESAEIICNLRKMEVVRRNTLFAQVRGDGEMVRRAVDYTKSMG